MKKVIAVFGPTASGKSSLAIELAKELNGVILSADSMQIYREMNVGTAKPTADELAAVPHRLIDICDPTESFSVYDYKKMAEEEIEKAIEQGFLPIIAGGTGLYFDALFFNTDFGEMEIDPKIRERLNARACCGEGAKLLEELSAIDPETAAPLHEKDLKRIIRGLEVFYSTGTPLSEYKKKSKTRNSEYDFLKIFLNFQSREKLYNRINVRVDQMMDLGLENETRQLLEKGYFDSPTASQAIGYKELLPYFRGERSLTDCIEILKQKTRNYAKRQLTWFRRYEDAQTIWMDTDSSPVQTALQLCKDFIKEV
ncbi:MAG: tRNA (adenosine(37)-N6)-dimethylallyltransferase MiaA [Clostridia bacterium]|nr:tRNA (adenosine(37)-N6)-dimethylallyltransferase MiaA [Clostridia bacterium]